MGSIERWDHVHVLRAAFEDVVILTKIRQRFTRLPQRFLHGCRHQHCPPVAAFAPSCFSDGDSWRGSSEAGGLQGAVLRQGLCTAGVGADHRGLGSSCTALRSSPHSNQEPQDGRGSSRGSARSVGSAVCGRGGNSGQAAFPGSRAQLSWGLAQRSTWSGRSTPSMECW